MKKIGGGFMPEVSCKLHNLEITPLFKEYIQPLISSEYIFSLKNSQEIFDIFKEMFPIHACGRVDWDHVLHHIHITAIDAIPHALEKLATWKWDDTIYILWNNARVPVIWVDMSFALEYIETITFMAPDTWLLCVEKGYIVEFFYEGEIVVGKAP